MLNGLNPEEMNLASIALLGRRQYSPYLRDFIATALAARHEVIWWTDDEPVPARAAAEAEILVVTGSPCDRALMIQLPRLRAIISPLIGIENISLADATSLGIMVVNGEVDENAESVAEASIMLLLASLYDLPRSQRKMRQSDGALPTAMMLSGKKIGILGYGAIARGVLRRLEGWGAELSVHTRTPPEQGPPGVAFIPLEALLRESDALLVLASLNASTYHLIDAERIGWMKRGAVIVNTSRGAIIDEAALTDALRRGAIARAALDVFEVEPLDPDSPLRDLPNVILTPHCVGHTVESHAAIPVKAAANVETVLAGRVPASLRNPDVLATPR